MKVLTKRPLVEINDIIHEQSYVNVKARLNQYLPAEYADVFAYVKILGNDGIWYGEDNVHYQNFKDASPVEKELIAIYLEDVKRYVCQALSDKMPYVESLFLIPAEEQIYWYKKNDDIKVVLTQWGFKNRMYGMDVDVIGILLKRPRSIVQQEVTIHVDYSDGKPAPKASFVLSIFNNEQSVETDDNGDYYLGKVFPNKPFMVKTEDGLFQKEFMVSEGLDRYDVVFDYFVDYDVTIENQFGETEPNFIFMIDGNEVSTDESGVYKSTAKLLPDMSICASVKEIEQTFMLSRDLELNHFVVRVERELPPPPPVEEFVTITLLDYDGTPLPDLTFQIKENKETRFELKTNAEGVAVINKKYLSAKDKYKINFTITPAYRKQLDKAKTNKREDGK